MVDQNEICYSIVEYMSDHSGYRCGYCKTPNTNYSHGMWAHRMNVYTYYHLINRGWRRSGKYCYKPTMDKTCCPQYTIRCDIDNFKLSKSQKKVLKRMHKFLSDGTKRGESSDAKGCKPEELYEPKPDRSRHSSMKFLSDSHKIDMKNLPQDVNIPEPSKKSACQVVGKSSESSHLNLSAITENKTKLTPGVGQDPGKPLCKKAKIQRLERRAAKLRSGINDQESLKNTSPPDSNQVKTLEDYLNSPLPKNPAHKLELRLVPVSFRDSEFEKTFSTSYELFRDYQMSVHGDPPSECDESSYKNFLIDGPLRPYKCSDGPEKGYGPFHQQYWLDGHLIAVGVLDILPCAVSSVYFYYDPKFAFLSLGSYSSLREIALTRYLSNTSSVVWCYYMGFYIHSCPKMRYKGQYSPSFLLCPETYKWVAIELCTPKLNVSKYSKLCESSRFKEDLDINKIQCLYDGSRALYEDLRRNQLADTEDDEVAEYLKLVGNQAASMILLYKS